MAHKVHPTSFRLGILTEWKSRWFSARGYQDNLQEEIYIREKLVKQLRSASIDKIEFERSGNKLSVIIHTARPGLIIGRGGAGADDLRASIVKMIRATRLVNKPEKGINKSTHHREDKKEVEQPKRLPEVRVEIREVRQPELYAALVGQGIAEQLEKRMPFRRVIKRTLDRVMMNKAVQGAKIMVKGRLDGSEMARRELVRAGRLPLQKLRADIDYAHTIAYTTYGVIGVTVWIYRGDKLEK
ncbi:MAG: 30S ribosomal protein S3 [Candidatus Spechtbacteria bacterium]|nr:30S ribosomal protein S3 [Candidatus Spechtbacteria bacterium]